MVIKGAACGRPGALAKHLERTDHNERVHVLNIWGLTGCTIKEALHEMHDLGAAAATGRTLYHGIINPRCGEELDERQRRIAVERLGKKLGLDGQPHIVVEHVKHGREQHFHVIWSRIDLDTMTGISDSHNYRKHEELARELEREFGHELTPGAHVRDKTREPRPGRTPSHDEMQQAGRTGLGVQEAKQRVTEAWRRTRTGLEFLEALEQEGFALARGDRRDYVLIDRAGEVHGLTRRVEGVQAADIRERLADLDPQEVPTIAEAKERMRLLRLTQELENGRTQFAGASERLRAEELQREREATGGSRPGLNHTDRDIADAIRQLERGGMRMSDTIVGRPTAEQRREIREEIAQRIEPEPSAYRIQMDRALWRAATARKLIELEQRMRDAEQRSRDAAEHNMRAAEERWRELAAERRRDYEALRAREEEEKRREGRRRRESLAQENDGPAHQPAPGPETVRPPASGPVTPHPPPRFSRDHAREVTGRPAPAQECRIEPEPQHPPRMDRKFAVEQTRAPEPQKPIAAEPARPGTGRRESLFDEVTRKQDNRSPAEKLRDLQPRPHDWENEHEYD